MNFWQYRRSCVKIIMLQNKYDQLASLNSNWSDVFVRDSSPHITYSRYAFSIMNEMFKARINKSSYFKTPRTLQKMVEIIIFFYTIIQAVNIFNRIRFF